MSFLNSLLRIIDNISQWAGNIIAWLFIPLVVFAMYEVIARYLFNSATTWVWEVNAWLMAALTILLGGYILLKNGHVTVDVLVRNRSQRARAAMDLITSAFFFIGIVSLLLASVSDGLRYQPTGSGLRYIRGKRTVPGQ